MSTYLNTIIVGLVVFTLLFYFILLLTYLVQYRRNGYFAVKEGFIFLTFIFYIEVAYFMTILPLPELSTMTKEVLPLTEYMQLDPFYFITEATKYFSKHGISLLGFIKAPPVYTTLFNILLLYPLGIYLKNLFKQSLPRVILLSFLVSLSFELIQLSGLLFIYPYPYRLFDVNDLFFNTLGGLLGGLSANYLTIFFKKTKSEESKSMYFELTKFKQFIIYVSDITILSVMNFFGVILTALISLARYGELVKDYRFDNIMSIIFAVNIILFAIVPLFRKKYQTFAMIIAQFYLEKEKDNMLYRLLRTVIVYGPFVLILVGINNSIASILLVVYFLYFVIHMFWHKKGVAIIDKLFGYDVKRIYDDFDRDLFS